MKINWEVRLKNRMFWLTIIPAVLLIGQQIAGIFGYTVDTSTVGGQLMELVNTIFVALALLGIVTDPTTAGVSDSTQALTYKEPRVSVSEVQDG